MLSTNPLLRKMLAECEENETIALIQRKRAKMEFLENCLEIRSLIRTFAVGNSVTEIP